MKLSLKIFDYVTLSLAIDELEIDKNKKLQMDLKEDFLYIENLSKDEEELLLQYYRDFSLRKDIAKDTKRIKELIVQRALYDII